MFSADKGFIFPQEYAFPKTFGFLNREKGVFSI